MIVIIYNGEKKGGQNKLPCRRLDTVHFFPSIRICIRGGTHENTSIQSLASHTYTLQITGVPKKKKNQDKALWMNVLFA